MKTFAIACAALMLLAATASAGDLAVSKSTLASMGLGGMQQISDTEGQAVRGKAVFAAVWGGSIATFPGQFSTNNYAAGASWLGPVGASASGNSFSFAGQVGINFMVDPTGFSLGVQVLGGISGGFANASAF